MKLKKLICLCGIILFFVGSMQADSAWDTQYIRKLKVLSIHMTTFKDGSETHGLLGVNYEYFYNSYISIGTDLLFGSGIIPSITLDLGGHLFFGGAGPMKRKSFEVMAGGGGVFSPGMGTFPTVFGGIRYQLTEKAGVYFSCRWVIGDFDVEPGIPFVNIGISLNLKKRK